MKLTSENVKKVITECLFKEDESQDQAITVEGITITFGFHPERLNSHKENIRDMLYQLPSSFQKDVGGGMSFLRACDNKDGEQWTGFQCRMEELFALGFATKQAKLCLPRDLWDAMPGGMPYIKIGENL